MPIYNTLLCGDCGHPLELRESNKDYNELWCQFCADHDKESNGFHHGRKASIHKSYEIIVKAK
jgi:hypothetical protein